MTQIISRASDVRVTEINLSQVITSSSITVAAFPIISAQGSTKPMHFTNGNDVLNEYGNPDPSVSMTIQSALNYFSEGNDAWCLRVVGSGAMYAGVLMFQQAGATNLVGQATADPLNTDLSTLVTSGQEAIALFYPIHGPGSYGDNISIAIDTAVIGTPTNLDANAQLGSGSMPATTYSYQVSAVGPNGESLASSIVQVVLGGVSVPVASITLTWDAVVGAIGYNLYGRLHPNSSYGLLAQTGASTLTFVDNGTITPDNTKQPITDIGQVVGGDEFIVSVYDNTKPNQSALEQFTCTLRAHVDGSGVQTELEDRINPFSSYIQVKSNVPALSDTPAITTVDETAMTGGDSGSTPTSYQIANAMQVFTNKQLYNTNVFVNGGISDPVYQLAIDTLVQGRGDAVSLLDTPPTAQRFQAAIDNRNLTLNLQSTYSAIFCPDLLQADMINGKQIYCPPSGWAAALCARTDRVANSAYSIAGLNRGVVNVLKQRYTYDDGQATELFNAQVNYFRTFVGQGIALWEQQTLTGEKSALQWLSVRRIVNVIKVALYKFLLYSLQEMDTDAVRRQIINSCSQYLDTVVNSNGLFSYTVECDNGNNTAATANAGILVVNVVLVPNIPIHEIQLNVIVSKQGVTFTEVLRQVNGNTQ